MSEPDLLGAFVVGPGLLLHGEPEGPLSGCTAAVKDLFDIAGHRTGAGNPRYLADHLPASTTASAVEAIRGAGADIVGKTHTDELAFGLSGENHHYGTPPNPRDPTRVPGGSSSGSAVAVAAGAVDLALGTDTGGSVRVPASYCGLIGLRPTHGRVPVDGLLPLSPSFDTVGFFAREPAVAEAAVGSLLPPDDTTLPAGLVIAEDAFARVDAEVREVLGAAIDHVATGVGGAVSRRSVTGDGSDLADWLEAFRIRQMYEAWQCHGAWIEGSSPSMGDGPGSRFRAAATVGADAVAATDDLRRSIRARVRELTADALVLVPSAPTVAPVRGAVVELEARQRIMEVTCIAGLGGTPAISLPLGEVEGLPVGLCLVGPPGSDRALVALGARLLVDRPSGHAEQERLG